MPGLLYYHREVSFYIYMCVRPADPSLMKFWFVETLGGTRSPHPCKY
jgi:hypothetical protein